jgi:hypothetical protein
MLDQVYIQHLTSIAFLLCIALVCTDLQYTLYSCTCSLAVSDNMQLLSISPTPAPTTVAPTTAAPITAKPTTAAPVTAAPTTTAPVTANPTTVAPVTAAPTIAANSLPVALGATQTVYDSGVVNICCVTGTDVDVSDRGVSANVISLPASGTLHKVISEAVYSGVLAAADSFGTDQLCLGYKCTGASTGLASDGYETSESFTFTVRDASGSQISAAATLTLRVYTTGML